MDRIAAHEHELTTYVLDALSEVDGITIIGPPTATDRVAEVSFTFAGIHPHDVGQILDEQGIAVRVGHHCARPAVVRYGIPATTRASFYLYNTTAEADALVRGLAQVKKVFS
jgi:cysteine desulfurase/selenocysteine lyase